MERCKKSGFTIIELLTVVAIIGLLIAILVPTIGAVRNTAKKAKSKVQFSQWTLAMEAFRQEYGYYPDVVESSPGEGLLDTKKFVGEMTGLGIDGTDPVGNVKKIRFVDFTREELVQTEGQSIVDKDLTLTGARIIDGFENTKIFVVLDIIVNINTSDRPYDGQVTVKTTHTVSAGVNPSPGGFSPVTDDRIIRSGIVFFSAGSGGSAADIVKSWE
jgi:prepilin-type N-terminal cleavage/methylation domain-containing protein